MRSNLRRVAVMGAMLLGLAGCDVTDDNIEHWKHTQRGPGKIATVLVEGRYAMPLRVHAARALIEMKHPNYRGLDVLRDAMQGRMAQSDREAITHQLMPELQRMLEGSGNANAAQGPTEMQIKAKDAAYVLIRGDGTTSFASAEDRAALSNLVLDWLLADFNSRALAGSYTAEQVIGAIGPSAAPRLAGAINARESSIQVSVELARQIQRLNSPDGTRAGVEALVRTAREVSSDAVNAQLTTRATELLSPPGRDAGAPSAARVQQAVGALRDQYLTLLFEAIRTLSRPEGTEYLLSVARDASAPLPRRKLALSAMSGAVSAANTAGLFEIANCAQGPTCDVELRGLAVDRLGESRSREALPQLFTLFDQANGGAADQSFTLRWKAGEAIIRLGGTAVLNDFVAHLSAPRAGFAGYTFAEINGYAQAIAELTPPPRAQMRALLNNPAQPAQLLGIFFLGLKGEQEDVPRLEALASNTTPITGEGWTDAQQATIGAAATAAKERLRQALTAAAQPAAAPEQS